MFTKEIVARMDRLLSRREKEVLREVTQGMTLKAIGKKFDISKERIRQIKKRAIEKLKQSLKE